MQNDTKLQRFFSCIIDAKSDHRISDGALVVSGRISRTGIQNYKDGSGGIIREYRPPEEVFSDESIASFDGTTVTDMHPGSGFVSPESFQSLSKGHIQNIRQDGDWLVADFFVMDADLQKKIIDGDRVEISAGYQAYLDESPGSAPDGKRYDAIQRNIRGNHIALLPRGHARAGRQARLLDSLGNEIPIAVEEIRTEMNEYKLKIDGIDYLYQSDGAAEQALSKTVSKLDSVISENEKLQAKLDSASDELEKMKEKINEISDAKYVDSLVLKRSELFENAKKIFADSKLEGSNREVMVSALEGVGVKDLQDRSDDYIEARFDAALEQSKHAQPASSVANIATKLDASAKPRNKKRFPKLAAARAAALAEAK